MIFLYLLSILWASVGVIDTTECLAVRFVEDRVAVGSHGPGLLSLPQEVGRRVVQGLGLVSPDLRVFNYNFGYQNESFLLT